MNKTKVDNNVFTYPMAVTLVGAMVEDQPNFLTVGWISKVNSRPPMVAVSLGKDHFTNPGIRESQAFSVNVPGAELVAKVDRCGLVSGRDEDKSRLFTVVRGERTGAPLIEECPLCAECRVVKTVDLPADELFIGEIVGVYADEGCLTKGQLDQKKIAPIILSMPDRHYWRIGRKAGKAWSAGKSVAG